MSRQDETTCLNKVKEALNVGWQIKVNACNCNKEEIKRIFDEANPNSDKNSFPDFFFSDGYIEHFSVTSSADNRKGSSFKSSENKNKKVIDDYCGKEGNAFFEESKEFGSARFITFENDYNNFSYLNFEHSFKKHFLDHVGSLLAGGPNGKAVFLVEQQDARMQVFKDGNFSGFYLISKDRSLLEFLLPYSNIVKYLVFISIDSVEIIDLSKLYELIRAAPISQDVRGGFLKDVTIGAFFDYRKK